MLSAMEQLFGVKHAQEDETSEKGKQSSILQGIDYSYLVNYSIFVRFPTKDTEQF